MKSFHVHACRLIFVVKKGGLFTMLMIGESSEI
jgi:hypothetical protein